MATQFSGKRFTFTQPDGTKLDVVGWGNQHEAVFETLDGHTVVQDPATGFYEFAVATPEGDDLRPSGIAPGDLPAGVLNLTKSLRRSPEVARSRVREARGLPKGGTRWEQRLAQKRAPAAPPGVAAAPPTRPTVGSYVGLVLLIEFPDVRGTIQQNEVEAYCNQQAYSGFGNNGSVRDYFADISGGKLDYTNVVTPYYTARNNRSYYTNEKVEQPIRARELIREALRHWKSQGFDFGRLTLDAEDCAYAVNVFYAGPCVNNWAKGLWPHSFHLGTKFELGPNRFAHDYQITNMGTELTLGTFCHENGHMICDFPDLYDYGNQSSGVGVFCLMCAGNFDEKNPSHVGAYLKYKAGWGKPRLIAPGSHNVKAGQNDFLIHQKNATEYFIIENRSNTARDASLPGSGLAIWHVDELGDNEYEQGTAAKHYECSLVQADGRLELERNRSHAGDAADLFGQTVKTFSSTTPPKSQWWDGSSAALEIDAISAPGPTMSFTVKP